MTHTCPVCGETRTQKGEPFGSNGSVIAHMSRSEDQEHKGIGYQKANQLVEIDNAEKEGGKGQQGMGDNKGSPTTDTSTTTTNHRSGGAANDNGSSGNPTMSSPSTSVNTAKGHQELPCGHESYDPQETPDKPFWVTCDECGKTWKVS